MGFGDYVPSCSSHLLAAGSAYARMSSSNDANRCGMAALEDDAFRDVPRLSRPAVRASRPPRPGPAEGALFARTIRGTRALRLNRRAGVGGGFGGGSECEAYP